MIQYLLFKIGQKMRHLVSSSSNKNEEIQKNEQYESSLEEITENNNWEQGMKNIDKSFESDSLQHKKEYGNILEKISATITFEIVKKDVYFLPQLFTLLYIPAFVLSFTGSTIGDLLFMISFFGIPISMWYEFRAIEYLNRDTLSLPYKIGSIVISLTIIGVYYYHITYSDKLKQAVINFSETIATNKEESKTTQSEASTETDNSKNETLQSKDNSNFSKLPNKE